MAVAAGALLACGGASSGETGPVRLVDLFAAGEAETSHTSEGAPPPRTEWRFDEAAEGEGEAAETGGWTAGPGVEALEIAEGKLVGKSTSDAPLIHATRTEGLDSNDLLHSVEVTMRTSAGANLSILFQQGEKANPAATQGPFTRFLETPILAGVGMRTYTILSTQARKASTIKHVLLRPTDAEDAEFEIESVRLVFLKEHLAQIPAGVGWHGLSDIYYESIVARSPETVTIPVAMPARPWLDLSIGTIEKGAVTFRVAVTAASGSESVVLERTVTTADAWHPARIDLSSFAGEDVTLELSLESEEEGAIGFWGSPVVRSAIEASPTQTRARAAAEPPQGVILIMADTLRADHMDAWGYDRPTAPTLSRLASQGALFLNCFSQATWTKVSAPSIMTSLYPTTHTVLELPDRLPSSAVTLAEAYRDAGYATLSFSSVAFTGQFTNLHQGFEQLHESSSARGEKRTKTAREYIDRLLPWLEDHRDVPFFVFLHVFDPHDPYEPYEPNDLRWADPAKKEEHDEMLEKVRPKIAETFLRRLGLPTTEELAEAEVDPEAFFARYKDLYDGSIRAMDTEIERLIERLGELGLSEKTLVVFVGDHGEEFLDHGRSFHGHTVYDELTHVPLIFWRPGAMPAGTRSDEIVQTIDLMPTMLELSGIAPPEGVQGRSLAPLIAAAGPWESGPAFSEKAKGADQLSINGAWESYAIVSEGWKLIHNTYQAEVKPEFELFDHRKDPLNQINVAQENEEVVQRLAAEIQTWRERAQAEQLKSDAETVAGASAEELKRLRALGYLK